MPALELDSSGTKVTKLQQALLDAGFPPGAIDGDFGAGTEAAVIAYQRSQGLLADGKAGPRTQAALGLVKTDKLPSVLDKIDVQIVAQMFPHTPLGAIKRNLPFVLAALEEAKLVDPPMVLMALATIRAETEGFEPIAEGLSRFNTSPNGHPFDLYDMRADLGNRGTPDGDDFKGRGFIQLTGRANYQTYGERLGIDLENHPDLASDPKVAARVLAAFLKDKELRIKTALLDDDLRDARRAVNGGSHGLDRFSEAYEIGDSLIA
ncbi:MAG: peptidoglycan-binding protein [Burkholderiaceae bacterium]